MTEEKLKLPFIVKIPVLALGGQTKNTLCFVKDKTAHLSELHPDLSNPRDLFLFEKKLNYFLKKQPRIIAYDLHPEYQSSKYALDLRAKSYELRTIQHHHAHIASCMAENGLENQKVIGVAFDGTGLGTDQTIWGAEVFICDYHGFQRAAHLEYIPLLGAEQAILEPARVTLAWLYRVHKEDFLRLKIDFIQGIDRKKWRVLQKMQASGFNSPLASSMGRLFDALASLVLVKYKANFEAELAMELERAASRSQPQRTGYHFKINKREQSYLIDPKPMFKTAIADLKSRLPVEIIAYRFHLGLAQMLQKVCLLLREDFAVNRVALSGGVFQNNLLLSLALDLLYKEGFVVYRHKAVSCNDSGISLGQAVLAYFAQPK